MTEPTTGSTTSTPDHWRYDGRRVVVTGCSSGIGREVAREVIALGGEVVGLDRAEPTDSVDHYVPVDLAEPTAIDEAVAQIDGPIDALFGCAGVSGALPARLVVSINFLGMRHLTEGLIPRLSAGAGITAVSSTGAAPFRTPAMYQHVSALVDTTSFNEGLAWCDANAELIEAKSYNISKAAVAVYAMRRSVELAHGAQRINVIGPGITDTPFLDGSKQRLGVAALEALPNPFGRFARPEEQARVLVFLNSPAASYISGQLLWVDGAFMSGAETGLLDGSFLAVPRLGEPLDR